MVQGSQLGLEKDSAEQVENAEIDKLFALGLGSVFLSVLVLVLKLFAGVSWRAAIGYFALTAISLVVAAILVVSWTPIYVRILGRAGGKQIAKRALKSARKTGAKIATNPPISLIMRLPFSRPTLGLWIPYVLNLVAVSWLIYFTGGIVKSPFASVPVIMFTLVVLLIDLPAAMQSDLAAGNQHTTPAGPQHDLSPPADAATSSDDGDTPKFLLRPFKVLFVVAAAFFAAMVVLNEAHPWHLEKAPSDGATLATTIAVASVGIGFAVVTRANILDESLSAASGDGPAN